MTEVRNYNNHEISVYLHDTKSKKIVIFCHGYRSSSIGPNRFFVKVAKKLEEANISSLRFDQYGSGNSEGDFYNSSFADWVKTTAAIAKDYIDKGYEVALFGQSMGGSTVIVAGSMIPEIKAVVAWVPDASVDEFSYPETDYVEESGQRVQAKYWAEAHGANVSQKLTKLKSPAYIVQCTSDEYVDMKNRDALSTDAQPNHIVEIFDDYSHSSWSYDQAEEIIDKSVRFIVNIFEQR
jgi:esterase/lipase